MGRSRAAARRLRERRHDGFGAARAGCGRGFQAAGTGLFGAWMEMRPGSSLPSRGPVYGLGPDGFTEALGLGAAGSLTVCDQRAYWLAETNDANEIRSWAPGEPVRVVYRSPPDMRPTTSPACANGWLTIVRAFTCVGERTEEVLAAPAP